MTAAVVVFQECLKENFPESLICDLLEVPEAKKTPEPTEPLPPQEQFSYHFNPEPLLLELQGRKPIQGRNPTQFLEVFYDTEDGFLVENNCWISLRHEDSETRIWIVKVVKKVGNCLHIAKYIVPETDDILLGDIVRDFIGPHRPSGLPGTIKLDAGIGPAEYLSPFASSLTTRVQFEDGNYLDFAQLRDADSDRCVKLAVATFTNSSLEALSDHLAHLAGAALVHVPGKAAVAAAEFRSIWALEIAA